MSTDDKESTVWHKALNVLATNKYAQVSAAAAGVVSFFAFRKIYDVLHRKYNNYPPGYENYIN